MNWVIGISAGIGFVCTAVLLAFIARLAWEIIRDVELVHVRARRSKWDESGDAGDIPMAYGACVSTARWVFGVWIRGGWRLTISRDSSNEGVGWDRFLSVKHAMYDADRKVWTEQQEKAEEES